MILICALNVRSNTERKPADYIRALAGVDRNSSGTAISTVDGRDVTTGDASEMFSIRSISKVFNLTMAISFMGAKGNSLPGMEALRYFAHQSEHSVF